jgi:hypothetical protein
LTVVATPRAASARRSMCGARSAATSSVWRKMRPLTSSIGCSVKMLVHDQAGCCSSIASTRSG